MDVMVHSARALALHTTCDMSIHIEGKGSGLVPEIFLYGLDVIAAFVRPARASFVSPMTAVRSTVIVS